jgi:hypothetical protein
MSDEALDKLMRDMVPPPDDGADTAPP